MQNTAHNLDISQYNLKEILELFNIKYYDFSLEELKNAKKKVLMMHPDKSKLPHEYFLFYKKAYEIVVKFYSNVNKTNEEVSETNKNTQYSYVSSNAIQETYDKSIHKKINSSMKETSIEEYNRNFNRLFEKIMAKDIPNKNEWFSKEEPAIIEASSKIVTANNINSVFEDLKKQTRSELILHRKPTELKSFFGESYYDEDICNEIQGEQSKNYVECDPFSKLKFEDLRKVHKDHTIFEIGEQDLANIPKYKDVNVYREMRSSQNLVPNATRDENQKIIDQQEKLLKERTYKLQHASELRTQQFVEKNKSIISNFLRIQWIDGDGVEVKP